MEKKVVKAQIEKKITIVLFLILSLIHHEDSFWEAIELS